MAEIRIKLDLPLDHALRIVMLMGDDAHECERLARYFDEHEKSEYAEFYRALADSSRSIREEIYLQIGDTKNSYIGGDEDEGTRA